MFLMFRVLAVVAALLFLAPADSHATNFGGRFNLNQGACVPAGGGGGPVFSFRAAQPQAFAAYPQAVFAQPLVGHQRLVRRPVAAVGVGGYGAAALVGPRPRFAPFRRALVGPPRARVVVGF